MDLLTAESLSTDSPSTQPGARIRDRFGDDEWDHRYGEQGVMTSMSGPSQTPEVCANPSEFARELGLEEGIMATELFAASGGRLSLGRAAVGVIGGVFAGEDASELSVSHDVASSSFADHVAGLAPRLDLGLAQADTCQAAVLSHLGVFTRQTALLVVAMVGSRMAGEMSLRDPEGLLMRLRLEGILVSVDTDDERKLYRIPNLIAGALRRELSKRPAAPSLIAALVSGLADHVENAQIVDAHILDDVLTLARKFEQWSQLARVQESVGLPMFLIAPRATCRAFGHLPTQALVAAPDLRFLAALTDDVLDRLANGSSGADIRDVVVEETRAGRMRAFFPGPGDRGTTSPRTGPGPSQPSELDGEPVDLHQTGAGHLPQAGAGHVPQAAGHLLGESAEEGFISTLARLVALTRDERHDEAASLGLAWSAEPHGRWAQMVVRLLTAISLFHSSQFRRSVSILSELESDATSSHVEGDFLLPAVIAWTALASVASGDHERADQFLTRIDEDLNDPIIVEELVHPAAHVALALRALDRLDLGRAKTEMAELSAYPENRSLWAYLPVIGRTIALLTATTESNLLFVNDDVEKHRDPSGMSVTGRDLLAASRSMVFISLGQLKWAEVELERMSQTSDARIVLKVRVEFVAGRFDNAIALADTWFYNRSLTPTKRAELAVIKSAALLRTGREAEAVAEFVTAIGLATWVSTLLPVVLLPQPDRNRLLDLTADHVVFNDAFAAFSGQYRDRDELIANLRTVGPIAVSSATLPQLSSGEAQLLDLLAQGLSIPQISTELHQVTGTVKNRLSALYRKFEVSGRSEVLTRARAMGFLTLS
ncbi:response regulator transcription factor [Brevibacterium marinum]|uniref:DNA-binding CsgD family transcriptional regulator n=1 Tax=Brevibacterium marinum TaxID=418643 RepID=A0A846RVF1_9MICO|nr:helix-turn-helix transcriptional regulator [Brevibacterium marinum]NJC55946.1 DNA-binding CsgD family transcriptional regulator [Brevibacterium marinum]